MADWPVQQVGSTGENVRSVQYLLNAHGLNVTVDGAFGPGTKGAVQQFQDSATQAVFHAWTQDNQPDAAKNASVPAVGQLFAQTRSPGTWTFAGCQGAAGSVYCTWNKADGGQLVLRTNDNTGAPFYFVTRATF